MSYERFKLGSGTFVTRVPKPGFRLGPISLSSAIPSPFRSVQLRCSTVDVFENDADGTGLYDCALDVKSIVGYLPTLPLMAVLPSPSKSYDPPKRSETSFQFGTLSYSGKFRAGTKRPAGIDWGGIDPTNLSRRIP